MPQVIGYAASSAAAPLAPFSFDRRSTGQLDVALDILFCGVCHSDLHTARNERAALFIRACLVTKLLVA